MASTISNHLMRNSYTWPHPPDFVIPSDARGLHFAANCRSLASLGMTTSQRVSLVYYSGPNHGLLAIIYDFRDLDFRESLGAQSIVVPLFARRYRHAKPILRRRQRASRIGSEC